VDTVTAVLTASWHGTGVPRAVTMISAKSACRVLSRWSALGPPLPSLMDIYM
jgi:hypothetical protein